MNTFEPLTDLSILEWDASFINALPADPITQNSTREVREAGYSFVTPTPVKAPRLLAWSNDTGELLGIAPPLSRTSSAVEALAGNRLFPGMQPYASRYGGHQFGHWAGQLGDGRAITLGERVHHHQRWELQLKGAGPTPYSRRADGRAVLRSSVREFLCSEAMYGLGIPTTRALSLVGTGEGVMRDMFYDGHPAEEPGAIVCRVAPSFVRFGHFELMTVCGEVQHLTQLADYIILQHFPELGSPSPTCYAAWFKEICRRTAELLLHWMRVGFVHGVMNTDNMSILGLTIDYGPYGWLEGYDPDWTPNTTDAEGRRYCYGQQPSIAFWNLQCLASALHPLINDKEALDHGLECYRTRINTGYPAMLAQKLGLRHIESNDTLLRQLFLLLGRIETDMTIFFRRLADVPLHQGDNHSANAARLDPILDAFYVDKLNDDDQHAWIDWLKQYTARVIEEEPDQLARKQRMQQTNPKYVLRNYLAQQAIDAAAQDDTRHIERLLHVMRNPYEEQPEHELLAVKRPEWARYKAGCSALSCSS